MEPWLCQLPATQLWARTFPSLGPNFLTVPMERLGAPSSRGVEIISSMTHEQQSAGCPVPTLRKTLSASLLQQGPLRKVLMSASPPRSKNLYNPLLLGQSEESGKALVPKQPMLH